MQLYTKRLEIKPISLDDKEAVLDLLTDKTVGKTYMLPEYDQRAQAEPLFRRLVELSNDNTRYVAGIYRDGQFIGMMNETEIKDKQIEMGYALLPAWHNRGYATESFRCAIEYLFACGFEKVVAGAFSENAASIRVMEKCGMLRQSQTDEIAYRGVNHTCVYYAAYPQPEILQIRDSLRLRKYDGHYEQFLPGYRDPFVYENSEGIFEESRIPDLDYVKRMCTYLAGVGELYYIEAKEGETYIPIGDVTVKAENPPIAIWKAEYRGIGIGKQVMQTVIDRLRTLGCEKITGSTVYQWNNASQRLHEGLGFRRTGEDEKEITYELVL